MVIPGKRGATALAVGTALLASTALTGCGADSGPARTAEPAGEGRALTKAERGLLEDAEGLLVRDCMRDRGFEIFLGETSNDADEPRSTPMYGNDDIAYARQHGLGIGDREQARDSDPNSRYVDGLSRTEQAEYSVALNGDPTDEEHMVTVDLPGGYRVSYNSESCRSVAKAELYGDFARWTTVETRVNNLSTTYGAKVAENKGYRKVLASWRTCMRDKGQPAESPTELRDQFMKHPEDPETTAAAVAEAQCGKASGLVRVGSDLEARYRAQAYDERPDLIADYQSMSVAGLRLARGLTSSTD